MHLHKYTDHKCMYPCTPSQVQTNSRTDKHHLHTTLRQVHTYCTFTIAQVYTSQGHLHRDIYTGTYILNRGIYPGSLTKMKIYTGTHQKGAYKQIHTTEGHIHRYTPHMGISTGTHHKWVNKQVHTTQCHINRYTPHMGILTGRHHTRAYQQVHTRHGVQCALYTVQTSTAQGTLLSRYEMEIGSQGPSETEAPGFVHENV